MGTRVGEHSRAIVLLWDPSAYLESYVVRPPFLLLHSQSTGSSPRISNLTTTER